ncbi:MAG: lipid A deacylase LpxR family protein [Opitutales bacterium]
MRLSASLALLVPFLHGAAFELPSPFPKEGTPFRLSLEEENDKFGMDNLDRYYTQGMRFTLQSGDHAYLTVTQEINTPSDTTNPSPPVTDLPYSGALHLAYGYGHVFDRSGRKDVLMSAELKVGVIGPSSGAETIQNKFHALIGTPEAAGWGQQIPDEFLINFDVELRRRFGDDRLDVIARSTAQLGSMRSGFIVGAQARWGRGLDGSWGHGTIRGNNAYLGPIDGRRGFRWDLFADVQAEVVVSNYATDGGFFLNSPSVVRRPVVGQFSIGAEMRHESFSFALFNAVRTYEFKTQAEAHYFGGFKAAASF